MLIMPKRIPEESKQRAIRLVLDHLDEFPNLTAACETVSARLGFGAESLRRWVRQAQVDGGDRQGVSSGESERIRRLERENRELREANAILRDAAVFFAGELDPRENARKQAKLEQSLAHATPTRRSGFSDDIAHAALFLASEEGSFINAHDLVVDGGRVAMFVEPPRDAAS